MKRSILLLLTAVLTAQSAPEVEITAEPHHHQAFANDQVRVFTVEIAPNSETLMHVHHHDYIYVNLGAAEVVNEVKGKNPVTVKLQDGATNFLAAGFAHMARNLSTQSFRDVIIELLQDDKLRHSPAHWDEDRGLEILPGGTQEILFVKDGVRVSEFELQPGATIPKPHHPGPRLLVAVSDLDLRSDLAGNPAVTLSMNSGESKWLPGDYSHTLTNTGQHLAKFVTLEFP
jgi:quercetin dioxygenase-like cupin family protein